MSVSLFYDEPDTETWLTILGNNRCYSWGELDVADRVAKICQQTNGIIFDCGCGWFGPGEYIKRRTGRPIIGITNSANQYKFIKSTLNQPVLLMDLEESPLPNFGEPVSAYFIQSFTHIVDPVNTLRNMVSSAQVTDIIIHDIIKTDLQESKYDHEWKMNIWTVADFVKIFHAAGLRIVDYGIEPESKKLVLSSARKWLRNMQDVDDSSSQIILLKKLCTNLIRQNGGDIELVYFHINNL